MSVGKTGKDIECDINRAMQVVGGSVFLLVDEIQKLQSIVSDLKNINQSILEKNVNLEKELASCNTPPSLKDANDSNV